MGVSRETFEKQVLVLLGPLQGMAHGSPATTPRPRSKPYDTFGDARGEKNARRFEVYGYTFMARKPG